MQTQKKRLLTTKEMAIIPIFSALTAIGAFIKIPIGPVPVSLQTVFVLLSGLLLGRKAIFAQLIYVLLGLMGLPVFTGGGGLGYVLTPTFGYLVGFIAAAGLIGYLREKLTAPTFLQLLTLSLLGVLVIYTLGAGYLYVLKNFLVGTSPMSLKNAIRYGALVFLPADTLWSIFAAGLSRRLLHHPQYKSLLG